jgi:hypothetical protein
MTSAIPRFEPGLRLIDGSKLNVLVNALNAANGFGTTAGLRVSQQPAPAAKTVTTTLTAAELMGGLITANQGGGAAASYTLPLASDLAAALGAGFAINNSFDFTLTNISTVAAEDVTILTNTGWTLVGSMVVASNDAATSISTGTFRVRRTGAATFTLYRL